MYIRKAKNHEASQHLNLADIQNCRITNSGKTVGNTALSNVLISKLELAFSFHDKNRNEVSWDLYNTDCDSLTLNGEMQLGERWCAIVNNKISEMRK
jgi:hypothetical protein